MDEDRIAGTAKNIAGKAQGRDRSGSSETQERQFEGIANQVKGSAQDLYGHAREVGPPVRRLLQRVKLHHPLLEFGTRLDRNATLYRCTDCPWDWLAVGTDASSPLGQVSELRVLKTCVLRPGGQRSLAL